MIKREEGFTLVELLITMVVFVLAIAAASQIFTGLLTQFKQQSKIAETNIEGIIGLEILRQDIASAGYGLPWDGLVAYDESSANPFSLDDAPSGVPRGIVSENAADFSGPNDIFDGSDYLVIKAVNVGRNDSSQKWTTLSSESPHVRTWTTAGGETPMSENLQAGDNVIVLSPGGTTGQRLLIVDGTAFSTTYEQVTSTPWLPIDSAETRVVYGINTSEENAPQRPFNRADYFISSTDAGGNNIVPSRCVPNTGVLVKATMNHDAAGTYSYLPLLDCVADMQVIFGLDNDDDGDFESGVGGSTDEYSDDISALSAQTIREQVKEVRVYIIAHEGQKDMNYTYPSNTITVGEFSLGRNFNLATKIGDPEYKYYRWKLYTIVVNPGNLR